MNIVKTPITDHVGDARRPPFADATFDLVYSSHCIEHVEWFEVEDTIAQWARILKPGGALEVFTVDAARLMHAMLELDETGKWTGPAIGLWLKEKTKRDPYTWAAGRLLNYAKKGHEFHKHRALITPAYLRRCFECAGLTGIEPLSEERGRKHGWISFGLRGVKC